jgi:5-(carboxyamino)imidazole ribonucleotide synthase
VQTHQHQQICDWVVLPAPVSHAVQAFARNVAASLLTGLDYVGVLAIEFFYGPAGLQVNEIAPRTHNSGHVTIEACRCSQFAQQVRIVAGLPMGSTDSRVPGALMVNLLGLEQELSEQEQRERIGMARPRRRRAASSATSPWCWREAAPPIARASGIACSRRSAGSGRCRRRSSPRKTP